MVSLRDYQHEAIHSILKALETKKKPMVSVATGGGKTTIISQLLFTVLGTDRALVIAHTEEIVKQIYESIRRQFLDNNRQISIGIVMGKINAFNAQIIVASRQSLGRNRLLEILYFGSIGHVIIDEAHHATPENTYGDIFRTIKQYNPESTLVGFTATPIRSDEKELRFFDEIVFSWTILEGITSGHLVPVQLKTLDISDFANILGSKKWTNFAVQVWKKYISGRPCLAFFPTVNTSRRFNRALKKQGYSAAHIDGTTDREERRNILESYKNGEIQIVCNVEVLTEGFDAPHTSAILLARPTHSKTLLTQILGRGLRMSEGKKNCLVVNLAVHNSSLKEIFN